MTAHLLLLWIGVPITVMDTGQHAVQSSFVKSRQAQPALLAGGVDRRAPAPRKAFFGGVRPRLDGVRIVRTWAGKSKADGSNELTKRTTPALKL